METGKYMDRMIELNADVGEGGPDSLLMSLVERVSIACGGHAGDESSMRQALMLASEHGVKAGAHPGYPDRENFGRLPMRANPGEIRRWVINQVMALKQVADTLGMTLFHVKPHGALYNQAAVDDSVADELISALQQLGNPALVALAGSPLVGLARAAGLEVLEEAFADRRYLGNGQLAPRTHPDSLIETPEEAASQARAIATGLPVMTLDGLSRVIHAHTLCLHGDGMGALERARAVALSLGEMRKQVS